MNRKIPIVLFIGLMFVGCSGTIPDLGLNNGELKPCPETPNCVNSRAADKKHYIKPIHFTGTQMEARNRLLHILELEPRTKIVTNHDNYIRVECTSALFRFVDDVEFYFLEKQRGETIIHVRSASRVGYSDFRVNRKRIEKIRSQLSAINKTQ